MHHSGELCAYFSMTCRLAQLYPVPLYELRMLIVMEFIIFCDMISLDCKLENELSNLVKALFVFNNVLFSVLHIIIITPSILYSMKKGRYIVPFFIEKSSDHQSGRMQTFPLFSTEFVHAYAFKGGTIYVINVHPFAEMW